MHHFDLGLGFRVRVYGLGFTGWGSGFVANEQHWILVIIHLGFEWLDFGMFIELLLHF